MGAAHESKNAVANTRQSYALPRLVWLASHRFMTPAHLRAVRETTAKASDVGLRPSVAVHVRRWLLTLVPGSLGYNKLTESAGCAEAFTVAVCRMSWQWRRVTCLRCVFQTPRKRKALRGSRPTASTSMRRSVNKRQRGGTTRRQLHLPPTRNSNGGGFCKERRHHEINCKSTVLGGPQVQKVSRHPFTRRDFKRTSMFAANGFSPTHAH